MVPEPAYIARRRVWQREEVRQEITVMLYRVGKRAAFRAKVVILGIFTDQQSQLQRGQLRQQLLVPEWRALRTWRQVAGLALAGVAKAHRYDGYFVFIVKVFTIQLQPVTQPVTAGIIPGYAAGMHARARGLPDDQDACAAGCTQYRVWPEWQVGSTTPAGAYIT